MASKSRIFVPNPATIRIHHGVAHIDVGPGACPCCVERSMSLEDLETTAKRSLEAIARFRKGERDVFVDY